ncbi:GNAT family N-acetyltransferase [Streptomyces sp. NBC_00006]|uniref:GNAT family N-acetyltransferase n=1 Tax=Streptomyces sp. NBC_00006 TaxID=2975619 RepID=UPI002B1DCBF5|nr:GNAT family N-acetyltransferase [Streptomyces sp. NBC_00006]
MDGSRRQGGRLLLLDAAALPVRGAARRGRGPRGCGPQGSGGRPGRRRRRTPARRCERRAGVDRRPRRGLARTASRRAGRARDAAAAVPARRAHATEEPARGRGAGRGRDRPGPPRGLAHGLRDGGAPARRRVAGAGRGLGRRAHRLRRRHPLGGRRRPCLDGGPHPRIAGHRPGRPVYTPPALRGRGYAAAVTAEVSRAARAEGAEEVLLFTDLSNPTSNALYQRLGYRPVREFAVWEFRR